MSHKEIKVFIMGGAGYEGQEAARTFPGRGLTIVGATGRNSHIGEDIGEIAGIGKLGIELEPKENLEEALARTKPDIILNATSDFIDIIDDLKICGKSGASTIVLPAEMPYPFWDYPEESAELDEIFKANGCSLVGLGMSDVWHVNGPAMVTANMHSLESVRVENMVLLEYVGPMEVRGMGLGGTIEEFQKLHHAAEPVPCDRNPMQWGLESMANTLGLTIKDVVNRDPEPRIAQMDHLNNQFGVDILKGTVGGQDLTVDIITEEGITLTGVFQYSFNEGGFGSYNNWYFKGDPDLEVLCPESRGDVGTTGDVLNRIPDIIKARPGFITYRDLPMPYFHCRPLYEYLDD